MSDLFTRLEDDRYMGQDGLPVYKYSEPDFLLRKYRVVRDAFFLPEHVAPLVASFAGATYAVASGDASFGGPVATFAFSFLSGLGAAGVPNHTNFMFQSLLDARHGSQVRHAFFDKKPDGRSFNKEDRLLAGKLKLANLSGFAVAALGVGVAVSKFGFVPEMAGAVTGITVPFFINAKRYNNVEETKWAFHQYRPPSSGRRLKKETKKSNDFSVSPSNM